MPVKSGRGRPTKYTTSSNRLVRKYTNDCLEKGIFPTFEGLATYLGVETRTLYDWELEHPDLSQTMDKIRDTKKQLLITNGLTGSYNTRTSEISLSFQLIEALSASDGENVT